MLILSGHTLSTDDMNSIRAHNFKVDIDLGGRSYRKLSRAFPQLNDLPTAKLLQARISFLSGIKPINYDCCINSCCCFTGPYEDRLLACPYCGELRHESDGRPRNIFRYLPLIPRLLSYYANQDTAKLLEYRSRYQRQSGTSSDVFDGEHYQRLCRMHVTVGDESLPHRFFSQPTDIAMGLSTDGFGPFKRRKQTCWPIIVFNYNLPPEIRFHLIHIICLGIIPGPKKPKDVDSFLLPAIEEFSSLARGVAAFDARFHRAFALHAYLILIFGDMPAIAMLMRMKGHNGLHPCRACNIIGIRDSESSGTTHYTPLHHSSTPSYDGLNLPLRTHDEIIRQATHVAWASNDAEEARRAKQFGINGLALLSTLSSISFPTSFPHDFMHIVENILPALASLWTGEYKGLDDGHEAYIIPGSVWDSIGAACKLSGDTIPSTFGCRIPNISKERHFFIAESWLLFATFLGPILLNRRFSRTVYYDHFISLVQLINTCLQLEISTGEINEIEQGFAKWVTDYERYTLPTNIN